MADGEREAIDILKNLSTEGLRVIASKYGIKPGTLHYFPLGHESGLGGHNIYFPLELDVGRIISRSDKIVTGEPVQKVMCVIDLDADDDLQTDAIEVYGLSKDHGWLLIMKIEADLHSFDPQSKFYHRVFKVVRSGQRSHVKFTPTETPEA